MESKAFTFWSGHYSFDLIQVQNEMVSSIHDILQKALQDYDDESRAGWILQWPGQAVICVSQMVWTRMVHQCLSDADGRAKLAAYSEALQRQLSDVVNLVRGKLSAQARIALGALVVVDVHAKDVVANLVDKG